MHEITLCRNIVSIVEEHFSAKGHKKVKSITLKVGRLSCVDAHALTFGFEAVAKGSRAEGAHLEIEYIEGVGYCENCQADNKVSSMLEACPKCGLRPMMITQGKEVSVKSMEVEACVESADVRSNPGK